MGATEDTKDDAKDAPAERGHWNNPLDFLFSCISVSVGLGNVWRFPYLCYKNGGGSFLIVYFISMALCGIPIFVLEVAVGQYLGEGGMTLVGKLCPILGGTGPATMVLVCLLNVYYCVIVGWAIFYLIVSLATIPDLPWDTCDAWWSSKNCINFDSVSNLTSIESEDISMMVKTTPVEDYWNRRVLMANGGLEEGLGGMQWELVGCLGLGWFMVYLIVWKGLNQSGKIIWFTALFPYVVLAVLLGRALTLDGAMDGLMYYVTPDWSYMTKGSTWIDGATQIFFAYSVGTGALPALGSYNKFNHNCYRDAIITCIVNTCTCLTAGVLVFAILGHMSHMNNLPIESVVRSGPGLVFLTYPELVLSLPASFFWAAIFFVMLLVLGVDSEFCNVEAVVTGFVDMWPTLLRPHRKKFAVFVCVMSFALGIPMCTQGGVYVFQLMDFYSASGMPLLWICFWETVALSWVFGAARFREAIKDMTGIRPPYFFYLCWRFFAPAVMAGVFIFYLFSYSPVKYGDYEYPYWAQMVGIGLSCASMVWVPLYAVYYLLTQKGSLRERIKAGLTPVVRNVEPVKEDVTKSIDSLDTIVTEADDIIKS